MSSSAVFTITKANGEELVCQRMSGLDIVVFEKNPSLLTKNNVIWWPASYVEKKGLYDPDFRLVLPNLVKLNAKMTNNGIACKGIYACWCKVSDAQNIEK